MKSMNFKLLKATLGFFKTSFTLTVLTLSAFTLAISANAGELNKTNSINNISETEKSNIALICENLMAGYAVYRDHLDPEGYSNIFSQDGVALLGNNTFTGRDQLRSYIIGDNRVRNAHMIMFTDHNITALSATEAVGVSTAVVLGGKRPVEHGGEPIQSAGFNTVNEYHTKFKLTDTGWKIAHIQFDKLYENSPVQK